MALAPNDVNSVNISQPDTIYLEEYYKAPTNSMKADMQPGNVYRQNGPEQSGCQKCIQCKKMSIIQFYFEKFLARPVSKRDL